MTVASAVSRVSYSGNGSTTAFAVPFYFLENAHLRVILRSSAGVDTVQTITTNYTVTGAGNPAGGTVNMIVAPASGETLVILRDVPETQETDYTANDPFPAESHERALDKLTMIAQQISDESGRAIKIPETETNNTTVPVSATRANKLLGFSPSGDVALSTKTIAAIDAATVTVETLAAATPGSSAAVAHIAAGVGAVATTVQAKLRESVSVQDFGSLATPASATAALTAALAAHDCVFVNAATYDPIDLSSNGKTLIMDCGVVFKLPDNTSVTGSEIVTSVLTISGDNISIFGDFTVDGNGQNNEWGASSSIQGSLNITGDYLRINDKVLVQYAYGPGVSVWNGTSINTADLVNGLYINEIEINNSRRYSAYLWGMENFWINKIIRSGSGLGGANATDERIRTGTQSSSSAYCQYGYIGVVEGGTTYESRTRFLRVDHHIARGGGSKAENCQFCSWGQITIDSPTVGTVYGWSFADEFPAVPDETLRSKNNHVNSLRISNTTYSSGSASVALAISDSQNITFDSIIIDGSGASVTDFRIRTAENIYVDHCSLVTTNSGARGYFDQGGYAMVGVVINNLYSKGHVKDVELQGVGTKINRINDDAVISEPGPCVQQYPSNFVSVYNSPGVTLTVGATGTFDSIQKAFQFALEKYRPAYSNISGYRMTGRIKIELESGYVWDTNILVDGTDAGWIQIEPESGATISVTASAPVNGINGAILPVVNGDYTKTNSGSFVTASGGSVGAFYGTLTGIINVPIQASTGSTIIISGSTITRDAGATDAATTCQALDGGKVCARNATIPRASVFYGGLFTFDGGTGGVSQTVNTLTGDGIIFQ